MLSPGLPNLITDFMNTRFCSIGEELSKNIPSKINSFISNQTRAPNSSLRFSPTNTDHLIKGLSNFKSSNGFSIESISEFFLKKVMPILAKILREIFNLCLSIGQFLDS